MEIAFATKYFVKYILLLLAFSGTAYAQYDFVQSRFITSPGTFSQKCSVADSDAGCMPNTDGAVRMRFDLDNVRIDDNDTADNSDDDRLVFKIEVRKISPQSGSALPYSVGGLGIDYNPALFGENLDGMSDVSEQCTYIRGDAFTGTASYTLTVEDTSPGLLSLFEVADDFTSLSATANSFSEINDDDWQDFIEMRCLIRFDADGNGSIDAGEGGLSAEAGIALSRRLWSEHQVWIAADGNSVKFNRTVFGFADNDLRGFRVDGKTWVQDYVRYDDGKGVRVQFSKGITTKLEPHHFVLDDNNATVNIQTRHEAGSAYTDIVFDTAISSGILRLVSTQTNIVRDESDEALADGSFVAALEYDADAPRAVNMVMVDGRYDETSKMSKSTWAIGFNKPLNSNFTITKNDLCITEMKGACAAEDAVSMDMSSIDSVSLNDEATTLTVMITEGNGQMGGMRSLEFRRNAVLGADMRVVEDYQTALRDRIELTDRIGPTITVTTATLVRSSTLPLGYDISFTVTANEIVGDLAEPQSYLLAGIKTDNTIVAYSDISGTAQTSADGTVTLSYQYEVNSESIEALQGISGFTLLRATASDLLDEADKEPIRVDDSDVESYEEYEAGSVVALEDALIDKRQPSVAMRADTDSPRLSLTKVGDAMPDMSDPLRYSGTFVVGADEAVADIANTSSYTLLRKDLNDELSKIATVITIPDVSGQEVTVHFDVTLASLSDVQQTAGFTLARGSATSLLDMDFNAPVREGNGSDIASGDPIDSAVVATRATRSLPISVEAVSLRRDIDPSANVRIYGYDAVPDSDNGNRYTVRFVVRAAMPIPDIAEDGSYSVIAEAIDGNNQSTPTISQVMRVEALVNSTFDTTTLTYSILMDSIDATRQTAGFALVRANDSLRDMYSNEPTDSNGNTINNGDAIDTSDAAFAERDTVAPQFSLSIVSDFLVSDGYIITFGLDFGDNHPADIRGLSSPGSYQLLRKLADDRYAALESDPSPRVFGSNRIRYAQVRLSEAEARETVALVLGRGSGGLLDLANNAPITVGLDNVPVAAGAPLDVSTGAESKPNEPHPSVTVEAQGMAMPDESNPLIYEGSFVLTANAPIENRLLDAVNFPNDIPSLADTGSYWLQRILVDGDDSTTQTAQFTITNVGVTNNISHSTSATLSFLTVFNSPDEVMQTKGFTLARRDNLLDYASNYPVDPVDESREVARGDRLDARDAAVALRDTTAPSIGVTRSGDLSIEPSGYMMTFEVSVPDDVPSGSGSDARNVTSYRLLRKLNDGNYAVVSGVLPRSVMQSGAIIVRYVNVPLLSPADALLTEGFTLGRTVGSLRNINGNDPVVEIEVEGTPQTVVVTVNPPLPLDAQATALFVMDRVNPKMTVVASGAAIKLADNRYSGSFNVWSGADATLDGAADEEAIYGIESTASYVLLRVPSGTNNPMALSDAVITVVADLNSYRSATVSFEVEDSAAAAGDKFTLGRAAKLTDLSGNPLIAHDATDASGEIGDGVRIDSRPVAEAEVPADIVGNPQITVTALPSGNGIATADPNNPLRYSGSFSVRADRDVTGIGFAGSYKLLRIAKDGTHKETTASSTTITVTAGETTADAVGEETTMTFAVTLNAATIAQTIGFTLGRKANLQDGETLPLVDAAREDRLDASARAVAEIEITAQITVLATTDANGIGAQPDEADGDRYSMTFVLRSSTAIADIMSTSSYILKHLPTAGDTAIADLSPYIETSSVDANPSGREATLRYTVRFTDTATQTQKTAGFTLGRADGALLGGESVIDASEAAKARRDTTPPRINVRIDSNRVSAAGYDIGFTIASDNNERVRGLASAGNYVLLRQLLSNNNTYRFTSPTAVITFTQIFPQSPIASVSLASKARLTVADARATAAFTIGYGGVTPLRDLANNDAVSAGNAALTVNQPYDSDVLAARDMIAPLLSVPRYEATLVESALDEVPAGNYYDIVFDISVDANDVRGLATASSYRLIRLPSNNEVTAAADTAEITATSPSQVTLSYRRVFLTLAQVRETTSFTLARALADADDPYDCKLCDFASNAPIGVGSGEVLDSNAIAVLDNEGESMRVIALGDAEPSEFSPNVYRGSFRVDADNPVTNIADVGSYSLLRVALNDGNAGDTVALATTPTLTLIGDAQATTSATIAFDVDLVDLRITQRTYGFTLGLAPNDDADDCNLCDTAGNAPIDEDGMTIAVGAPLDSTSVAIARRDIEAPVIQVVVRGGPTGLTIGPSGYSMSYEVTPPSDVVQTANSAPRLTSSYSLLRKDKSGNYAVVPTSPPQPIAQAGAIVVTYDNVPPLPIAVMNNTDAFALGIARDGIFRDAAGNDAVVDIEGMTEVVTVNPRRPLDARDDALFTIERDAPTITVTANADSLVKKGDLYTGSFDVSGSEAIDGIISTASYVLLRVRLGEEPVPLASAQITLSASDLVNYQSETVNFRVTDTAAQDGDKFTLGRAANLTDLAGNEPVDPGDGATIIATGDRIDSRPTAELVVPAADTTNPIIMVTAVGMEGMEAVADAGDPLVYSGEFKVKADKAVTGIRHRASYKLLRITNGGVHERITATLGVSEGEKSATNTGTTATITFTTMLSSAEVLQQTVGFTLGRLANLVDTDNQVPISYTEDRLDVRDEAVAAIDVPLRITVTAEQSFIDASGAEVLDPSFQPSGIEAVPYLSDGNRYNLSFRVRSNKAIADIHSTSSYILTHLPTEDDTAIADLSPYISASQASTSQIAMNNREAVIKYTVRFVDIADTRRTAGFVLHRASDSLQDSTGNAPLDGDGNPINAGEIIDGGEEAISRRDTASSELRTVLSTINYNTFTNPRFYRLNFNIETQPSRALNEGGLSAANYVYLRVLDTEPPSYAPLGEDISAFPFSDIYRLLFTNTVVFNVQRLFITEREAKETVGFTLGYAGGASQEVYSVANNEVFRGGTSQTFVVGQPIDARPDTWVLRDRIPPVIEVRATTATAVGNDTYDVSFNVHAKHADDLTQGADVLFLDSPASYQLLLEYEAGMYEKVQSSMSRVTRIDDYSATVHYGAVSLAGQSRAGRLSLALGRASVNADDAYDCKLCDIDANAPVAAPPAGQSVDTSEPLTYDYVDDGEPFDANSYAKATIIKPRIKVTAVGGIAQPSLADGDEYTLQFKVEANEAIQIASADSYRLLHIPTKGRAIRLSTSNYIDNVNVVGSTDNRMSTITYVVKFDDTEAQTQRTEGFTLGSGDDLKVVDETDTLLSAGEILDASDEAIALRDTIPPQIAIAADGKAIRYLRNAEIYNMNFDVTVANDEEVRGFTDPASYQLLRFIKDVTEPTILDGIASTVTVTTLAGGGIKLSYVIDMNNVRNAETTDAFTLGRDGTSLRDLANNDPVDANPDNIADKIDEDGEPLDSRNSALAELIRGILLRVRVFLEGPLR